MLINKSELRQNVFWRGWQFIFREGALAILFFIAAATLGPKEFGLASFFLALAGLYIIVTSFGLPPAMMKFIASAGRQKGQAQARAIFWQAAKFVFLLTIALSLLSFFLWPFLNFNWRLLAWLWPLLFLKPLANILDGIYRGLGQFKKLSLTNLVVGPSSLALGYLLIKKYQIVGFFLTLELFYLFSAIALFWLLPAGRPLTKAKQFKKIAAYGFWLALVSASYFLYSRLDIIILKSFGFLKEIAYYEIIDKIFAFLLVPSIVFGQTLAPAIARLKANSQGGLDKVFLKLFLILGVLGLLAGLVFYCLAPLAIKSFFPLYYSVNFLLILKILTLLLPFYVWGVFLTHAFIIPLGLGQMLSLTTFIGGVNNIIFDFILIKTLGFAGVFWATLFIHSAVIIFQTAYCFFSLKNKKQ